ncbi:MAG: recombinase zinc beta ribbon domain-containing protein, partial [Actinobacteria bacterium]|nr:recombinase zinc beta ribbon domain-containing protein [Actinomycetota bacterium]
AIKSTRQVSRNGHRVWELSGGIGWCGLCGAPLATHNVTKPNKRKYFYYRCGKRARFGSDVCPHPSSYIAHQVEAQVWGFVCELLKDPERLRVGLEEHIQCEREAMRYRDPEKEMNTWLSKLSELDQERRGYQRLAARGHMTDEELDEAMSGLEESRRTVKRELEALEGRCKVVEDLERDRDAILETYARLVREELNTLPSEDRQQIYKMLRLRVTLHPDRPTAITGIFVGDLEVCESETTLKCHSPQPQLYTAKIRVYAREAERQSGYRDRCFERYRGGNGADSGQAGRCGSAGSTQPGEDRIPRA